MSVQNPERLATKQDLADMYSGILPYLGGMPEVLANKFSKGDLYSTDEKMIGTWIDGKPLYQRMLEFGEIAIGAFPITDISSWNIDQIVKMDGLWLRKDAPCWYNFTGVDSQTKGVCVVYGDHTGGTYIYNASNYVVAKAYVFYQYTKTTDSSISIGEATDYSTDEKIIGTWLSGEPIYQKTVSCGALPNKTLKMLHMASLI